MKVVAKEPVITLPTVTLDTIKNSSKKQNFLKKKRKKEGQASFLDNFDLVTLNTSKLG